MEGVWQVHIRCLEVRWKVSCWPLLVSVRRVSEGCLEGVWKVGETCLECVLKVSGGPDGPVWPHLAMEFICKCLNAV